MRYCSPINKVPEQTTGRLLGAQAEGGDAADVPCCGNDKRRPGVLDRVFEDKLAAARRVTATVGLGVYAVLVSPPAAHDAIRAFLTGVLLAVIIAGYRRAH